MLTRVLGPLINNSPNLKRTLWRRWYEFLARGYPLDDWTFMNYGFAPTRESNLPPLVLDAQDEPDRCSIHLYHRVVTAVDVRGARVLEVGSGRGGGCSYIARYLGPEAVLGIDFSDNAVALSRRRHTAPGLSFQQGDAEALPCEDATFDAVVNVESSHCYGSMERFLAEVVRVLKPGGHFLWTDMRPKGERAAVREQFRAAGLEMVEEEEITPYVLAALDYVNERKRETISRHVPRFLMPWFEDFAGVRGTRVYESLRAGDVEYWRCALRKV